MKIEIIKTGNHVKELVVNNKSIGELIRDIDGYFYFWPNPTLKGSWNSNALKLIASKLDEVNSDMDKSINEYFLNAD